MKTTTKHNNSEALNEANKSYNERIKLAPKPGSTVAMSCYQGVNRNIRGDMFRRLFVPVPQHCGSSFLFAEKEMNKKMRDALKQNYLTQPKNEKIMNWQQITTTAKPSMRPKISL